jgi:hypothetical protein
MVTGGPRCASNTPAAGPDGSVACTQCEATREASLGKHCVAAWQTPGRSARRPAPRMAADAPASLRPVDLLALASETTSAVIAAGAALGGAVIGGLITLFTSSLQNRHARAEREDAAAAARRARAAEILGRVRTFLTDIDPARVGFNVNPETTPEEMKALAGRLNTLRDELSVFSAAADDDRVMDAAAKLEVALFNTFNRVSWHARDLLTHGGGLDSFNSAQREHVRATTLVRIVLDLVRDRDVVELETQLRRLGGEKPGNIGAVEPSESRSETEPP